MQNITILKSPWITEVSSERRHDEKMTSLSFTEENLTNSYYDKLQLKLYILLIFEFIVTVLSIYLKAKDYVQANVTKLGISLRQI